MVQPASFSDTCFLYTFDYLAGRHAHAQGQGQKGDNGLGERRGGNGRRPGATTGSSKSRRELVRQSRAQKRHPSAPRRARPARPLPECRPRSDQAAAYDWQTRHADSSGDAAPGLVVADVDVVGCGYVGESGAGSGSICAEGGEGGQGGRRAQGARDGAGVASAWCACAASPVFAQWQVLGYGKVRGFICGWVFGG